MTTEDDSPRDRRIPAGRLGRLARLASVGARMGASAVMRQDGNAAARHAAEMLGTLRGVAAKVGQMAGYVDGVVPESHRDAYEKWMKSLLSAAPTSDPAEVRELIEAELGAPVDELFARFDAAPIASASIGQVHRAELLDGRPVVVKVQHPKVAQAVESDLDNAGLLEGALSMMGTRKFESARVLQEVRDRFREELDYGLEAERQRAFRAIHTGDPTIRIPDVIDDRSSKRVLTTELARGVSYDEACSGSPEDRRAWSETLWRFVFKGTLVGGMFNADPHPGNYFFGPGGEVTFIDFGCVQPLPTNRRDVARRLHQAAYDRRDEEFRVAVRDLMGLRGGRYEERAQAYIRHAFEPLFGSPYRITRPYVVELVQRMRDIALVSRKDRGDNFVPIPPNMFFMNRLQFGFYSVLARLDAEVDYAAVERGFMARSLDARSAR